MFRKRKENPPLTRQEAFQKLRSAEEMLSKKDESLEKQIDVEEALARKLIASNNDRKALRALKRKKDLLEDQKENDRLSAIVKSQRRALEGNRCKIEVAKSLFEAAKGLISDAPQVQDNVRETIDYIQNVLDGSDNISRAPSQSEPAAAAALRVEVPVDESQEDLMRELEALKLNVKEQQVISLPGLPTNEAPAEAKSKAADDDLRELEAWAN